MYLNSKVFIAEVAVDGTSYSHDALFSYAIPSEMIDTLKVGCRVVVPFGRGNKRRNGVVMRIKSDDFNEKNKQILYQSDENPIVSQELIDLAFYLCENTFCSYYEAVKCMLPPAMNLKISEKLVINTEFSDFNSLEQEELNIYNGLIATKSDSAFNKIIENLKNSLDRNLLQSLIDKSLLVVKTSSKYLVGDNTVKMVKFSQDYLLNPQNFKLTVKQKQVVEKLKEYADGVSEKELLYMSGVTKDVVKRLVSNGVAVYFESEIARETSSTSSQKFNIDDVVLSNSQQNVYDNISEKIENNISDCFLLHGVTGSGKTSVFEKLIQKTISLNKTALLLIPEISLTPQILKRFKGLFGERIAVIHSGLSKGKRYDEFKRISRGEADIVIGTRSAIFAPIDNIGLIIMDEEGERSYKSESSPRYNTVEIAKQRCRYHHSVLLLASATPSIESYYKASKGIYKLLELNQRYNNTALPKVQIVDMSEERRSGNLSEFSKSLVKEISLNLEKKEQSIILLNRRGYHTIISCVECSSPVYCPNCTVPMTFHKTNNKLMCHYCGYSSEMVSTCSECGSNKLKQMGFGTQRLEEELEMFFPKARVLRMDADTTFSRNSYEVAFQDFSEGKYDILIGTQMIGKGLDFPNVTLVGVLSIDKSLFAGDFRCYERTFSLVTQVVGRSGRAEKNGRALLQTFIPEHYVIDLAANQDYLGFYNEEIVMRRSMIYPPICDMCVIGLSAVNDEQVKIAADKVIQIMTVLKNSLNIQTPMRVLGPVKCSYLKICGKFRYRIIIKCKNTSEMRNFISTLLKESMKQKEFNKVSIYADMNGDLGV